jgi:hypothetical protein
MIKDRGFSISSAMWSNRFANSSGMLRETATLIFLPLFKGPRDRKPFELQ